MTSKLLKPYAFREATFALLLNLSTAPRATCPLVRNQLSSSLWCVRSIRATFFIGLRRELIVRRHHGSRNLAAQATWV